MQPFNLPCNFVGGICALMWCCVWNSVFIVFWLYKNKKGDQVVVFLKYTRCENYSEDLFYFVLDFLGIYVAEKDIENGNTGWKYVASTTDPLTSDCHINFKIYEGFKLQ